MVSDFARIADLFTSLGCSIGTLKMSNGGYMAKIRQPIGSEAYVFFDDDGRLMRHDGRSEASKA